MEEIRENTLVQVHLSTDDGDLADFIEDRGNPIIRITEVEREYGQDTGVYWGEVESTGEPVDYALQYHDLTVVGQEG